MRTLVATFVVCALLGGCSSGLSGRTNANTSATSATSASTPAAPASAAASTPAAALHWRSVLDRPTGLRFQLPGAPSLKRKRLKAKDGSWLEARRYIVTPADNLTVEVEVTTTLPRPTALGGNLDAVPAVVQRSSVAEGNQNVAVLEKRHLTVHGHAALCFRLSFDPPNPYFGPSVLLDCVINDGNAVIDARTNEWVHPSYQSAALARDRRIQNALVGSIQLI